MISAAWLGGLGLGLDGEEERLGLAHEHKSSHICSRCKAAWISSIFSREVDPILATAVAAHLG